MNDDFLDLLSALNAASVRYLVVGAYAVGVHGHPRATKDLDVWVEATADNASRVMAALRAFGAPLGDLAEPDLAVPGMGFKMGVPPRRIDILTTVSGLAFEPAWQRRVEVQFGEGTRAPVLGLTDLIANKRAAARAQDLADAEALERVTALGDSNRSR
jgi:hypothetical protein